MAFIVIDINSDLPSTTYEIDLPSEQAEARRALRDAGLAYEHVWYGEPGCPDAIRTEQKLFAARD